MPGTMLGSGDTLVIKTHTYYSLEAYILIGEIKTHNKLVIKIISKIIPESIKCY